MKIFNPSPKDSITFRNISWIFRKENVCTKRLLLFLFLKKRSALTQLSLQAPLQEGLLSSTEKNLRLHCHIAATSWHCCPVCAPGVCSNFLHFFLGLLGFDIWILIEIWNKNQQKSLQVSKNNLLVIKRYFWWTFRILTNNYVI